MSRNRHKPTAKSPSVAEPGNGLPPEVLAPEAAQGAREKQRAREENEMFSSLRRELGSGGFVTLSRCHPGSGQFKQAHIGQIPIEDFSVERVAQIYGGGDYVAKGRTAGGTFLEAPRNFSIDHSIPPKNPNAGEAKAAPAAPALDVAAIVREVGESSRREAGIVVDLAKTILSRPQEGSGQMMEMFKFLAEQQAKAAEQFRDLIQKGEERTAKILEKLAARDATPAAAADPLEHLEKLIATAEALGFTREKGEGDDWKAELFKFAKEAMPVVMAKLQIAGAGNNGLLPQVMQPVQTLPAPAPVSIVSTGTPGANAPAASAETGAPAGGQPTDDMMIQIALNFFRSAAIAAAKKGKDPYEFICDKLDELAAENHGVVFEKARSADWFANFFAANAEATQHLKFLTELREALFARALVAHAIKFAAVNKAPLETAMQFAGWLPEDARNAIWQWCDAEDWAELFEGVRGPVIAPSWLEELRVALDKILGGEEAEPAKVEIVPDPPAAAKPAAKKTATRKTA